MRKISNIDKYLENNLDDEQHNKLIELSKSEEYDSNSIYYDLEDLKMNSSSSNIYMLMDGGQNDDTLQDIAKFYKS